MTPSLMTFLGLPPGYAVHAVTVDRQQVTIGGQQWQQLDCGDNRSDHWVVESIVYEGTLYSFQYGSDSATFASDKTQYFSKMKLCFIF